MKWGGDNRKCDIFVCNTYIAFVMRRRLIENEGRYANGVYIQTVDGKLYTKEEWEAHKPADGVYIESVDGDLYTKDQWIALLSKPESNGVCAVSGGHIFTIESTDESSVLLAWKNGEYILVDNVLTTSTESTAKKDFNGNSNTGFIVSQLGSNKVPAATYCQNYTFPNGSKGYLPSYGEWQEAYNNKTEIDACISLIGGTAIETSSYYWSSTQHSNLNAWGFSWSDGTAKGRDKSSSYPVRVFTTVKKYTPKGIAVVADEIIFVIGLNDSPRSLSWQTTAGDITGLSNITALNIVRENFNGKLNSDIIAAASNGGDNSLANSYCQKYIFSDGSQGYLPSCGELYVAFQNKVVINEFLNLVGSAFNASNFYWSSSEYGSSVGWGISFYEGIINTFDKITSGYVRPFGVFDA